MPPIAFNHNTHTIGHAHPITHLYPHIMVHTHGWMVVERLDDHTVMTNTPWFHGNHSLHQHHCGAQHPHPTHHSCRLLGGALATSMPLCAPPVAWKAWCCACHVLPFHSFHSCPPLCPSHSLSVSLALTLCRFDSGFSHTCSTVPLHSPHRDDGLHPQ